MKYPTIFDAVYDEFTGAGIPFLLIGGFAMNAHGIHRNTKDVDFLICSGDFEKADKLITQWGYRLTEKEENFARYNDLVNRQISLDLMFVEEPTLRIMLREGRKTKIVGKEFTIPECYHLIALKLHALKGNPSRDLKDLSDIVSLIRTYKIDIRSQGFKAHCEKFGTGNIYEKIKTLSEP